MTELEYLPVQKQLEKKKKKKSNWRNLCTQQPRGTQVLAPLQQLGREHATGAETWIVFLPMYFFRTAQVMGQSSAPSSLAGRPLEQSFRFQAGCHRLLAKAPCFSIKWLPHLAALLIKMY